MKQILLFIVVLAFSGFAHADEINEARNAIKELRNLDELYFKKHDFTGALKKTQEVHAQIAQLNVNSVTADFNRELMDNVRLLVKYPDIDEEQHRLECWIFDILQKRFSEIGGWKIPEVEQNLVFHNPRLVPDFPKYRRERTDAIFQYISKYTYALRPEEYEKVLALKKEWDDYYNSDEFPTFRNESRANSCAIPGYGYLKAEKPYYLADESQKDRYVEMLEKIRAFRDFETDQRMLKQDWPKEMPEILDYLRKFYSREPFALEELKELSQKYPQEKTFKKELKKLIAELQKAEKEAKKAKKKSSKSKTKKAKKAKEDLDE